MWSNAQKGLLKRAQAAAGLADEEYRTALATVSGWADCRSSTDARLTDRQWDLMMAYVEAIHWGRVDAGELQVSCKPGAVFKNRGYWSKKNPRENTSRDRFVQKDATAECLRLENALAELGYGLRYFQAIQARIVPWSLLAYRAALTRTLESMTRKLANSTSVIPGKNIQF